MTYREFPDIEIPDWLADAEDRSWHNDACAKSMYSTPDPEQDTGVVVWVNYADPAEREVPERYMVQVIKTESDWDEEPAYCGDDEGLAIEALHFGLVELGLTASQEPWCGLCGTHHLVGNGPGGFSCEAGR